MPNIAFLSRRARLLINALYTKLMNEDKKSPGDSGAF